MYRDTLVLLTLCCSQNHWVEVIGETLWIDVKKAFLRVKTDLRWKRLLSRATGIIGGIKTVRGLTWHIGGVNRYGVLA